MGLFKNIYNKLYKSIADSVLKKMNFTAINKDYERRKAMTGNQPLTFNEDITLYAMSIFAQTLKSPTQVVYPPLDEFTVEQREEGLVVVTGYCDAPNSYGALTRTPMEVWLKHNGTSWEYVVSESYVRSMMTWILLLFVFPVVIILLPTLFLL